MAMGKESKHDDYPMVVNDLALLCKSINQGWEMGDDTRALVVSRLQEVLSDSTSTKREINRASQTLANIDKLRLQSAVAAKSIVEKAPPTVIIQQAAQDDPVRRMIENADETQLAVIADLLRATSKDERESTASRDPATEPIV